MIPYTPSHVVDVPFENVNQPYVAVSEMPAYLQQSNVIFRSDNAAFSVEMINKDGVPQVQLSDLKVINRPEASQEASVLSQTAAHGTFDDYLRALGQLSDAASFKAVDSMLAKLSPQQRDADNHLRESERVYVPVVAMPPQYNKANAVRFMRFYGQNLMHEAILNNNQRQMDLGNILVSYSNRLDDSKYNLADVRDMFNAIGQRESFLMGGNTRCNQLMGHFDRKLYEMNPYKQMFRNYAMHRSYDYDFIPVRPGNDRHLSNKPHPMVIFDKNTTEIVFELDKKSPGRSHTRV